MEKGKLKRWKRENYLFPPPTTTHAKRTGSSKPHKKDRSDKIWSMLASIIEQSRAKYFIFNKECVVKKIGQFRPPSSLAVCIAIFLIFLLRILRTLYPRTFHPSYKRVNEKKLRSHVVRLLAVYAPEAAAKRMNLSASFTHPHSPSPSLSTSSIIALWFPESILWWDWEQCLPQKMKYFMRNVPSLCSLLPSIKFFLRSCGMVLWSYCLVHSVK